MADKVITHNGVEMAEGWPLRIEESRRQSSYVIAGRPYHRITYGAEGNDWGADDRPCHDCAVVKGQYHVPGCDLERCPRCGGQAISCACSHDDDTAGGRRSLLARLWAWLKGKGRENTLNGIRD